MQSHYTPAVQAALQTAADYARAQGASAVQPLHLLQALFTEEEGRAATAAAAAGLDLAGARGRLAVAASPGPSETGQPPPPLDKPCAAILAAAHDLARDFSEDHSVSGDLVLVALLRQETALRAELETLGLDLARLEAKVLTPRPPLRLDEPLHLAPLGEKVDTARVLDAAANRAREGLRVVEDYCRFVLDDALLSGELKQLRHELTQALTVIPGEVRLEARETLRDVGTELATPQEQVRLSPREVARANLKRLQEALRSLEEFGKLYHPDLGKTLEKQRYRSYTLEKAIVLGTTARERLAGARLCVLVSGAGCTAALDWTIAEAAAGGAQVIQLREKGLSDRELLERARRVRRWTRKAGVLFVLNDRPDLARLVEADGVHVGQEDLPVHEVRKVVGPAALIGVSTHNLGQLRQAVLDGASYLGVGPTFSSGTKEFAEFAGLDFVRQAAAATSLPAFVIGGVGLEKLPEVIAAGARRVAVGQAVCRAEDPRAVASHFRAQLDSSPNV
jgi:thiamine-phosphate pyrophosphorylase